MNKIEQFNKDHNEALLSLDYDKICEYMEKYEIPIPQRSEVFWGSIHKAITGCLALPLEFRKKSKIYLNEHNLQSLDDGDL